MSTVSLSRLADQVEFIKPGRLGLLGVYLAFGAVFLRTFTIDDLYPQLPVYLALELVYLALFTLMFTRSRGPSWLVHLYFTIQSLIVLGLVAIYPEFDFVVVLFMPLSFQVALFYSGTTRWIWIAILVILTGGSLIVFLDVLRGLALSLTTVASEIVIPAYVLVNQEIQAARQGSQSLLDELQETHQQLELYSLQVEELAAIQERNRLARELHDTVSQMIFTISLTTRSTQLLLEKEPRRVAQQLDVLGQLTSEALKQLRSLITQLRPPQST